MSAAKLCSGQLLFAKDFGYNVGYRNRLRRDCVDTIESHTKETFTGCPRYLLKKVIPKRIPIAPK
jgi:hypothetical protein